MHRVHDRNMKRMVIMGGGESGTGAAVLARHLGYDTFLTDMGKLAPRYKEILDRHGIPYEEGHHTEELVLNADEVVKSPGIPLEAPLVRRLMAQGTPVISEIEFAARHTRGTITGITGSNGKTTTTLLLHHIMEQAGKDTALAGNVGRSMALQVAEGDHDTYVVELSSFQLDNCYDMQAHVAILLNITPDHLDRYDHKMENYARAKMRVTRNQRPDDCFIYWNEDPETNTYLPEREGEAVCLPFTDAPAEKAKAMGAGAYVTPDGELHIHTPQAEWSMPVAGIPLPGRHNLHNVMAAAVAATFADVEPEKIRSGIESFKAVEHRLEYAGTVGGARYINDSKATNVDSTFYALESMTTPTVLILGGKDKGNDYGHIADLVRRHVKAIVCMGVDNSKLKDYFGGFGIPVRDTHSLADALKACREEAAEGDTVLLSPCCASFDLFKSYEDRGDRFKAMVRQMEAEEK